MEEKDINKKSKQKRILFRISRPYHLLLAIAFATKLKQNDNSRIKNYLIMVDSFNKGEIYNECLNLWGNNLFEKILILPLSQNIYKNKNKILHCIMERENIKIIKNFTRKILPNIIYVFNDVAPYSQAALQIQQRFNCGKAIYIEDGTGPYWCKTNLSNIEKIKLFLNTYIYYGGHYPQPSFQGSHPQITEMYVNCPELIDRKRYSRLKINKIDENLFNIFKSSKFFKKLLCFSGCKISELNETQYIIVLPQATIVERNNKVLNLYKLLFKKLIEKKYNFIIKYHPKDYNKKYIQIKSELITEIPTYLPLEIIYIILRDTNRKISIIGDISTSILITPGVLLPNAKVYSLIKMMDYKNKEMIEKFKNRVNMIRSLEEIEGL